MVVDKKPLLVILGPTASGKTRLAVNLSSVLTGEIISADSRQVFEKMDIGTGKDLNEYVVDGREIPYHLINIKQAGETYNVNEFKDNFYEVFKKVTDKKALPVLCGGSGMYIHSILQNHEYTAIPPNATLRTFLETFEITQLRGVLSKYSHKFTLHADQSSRKRLIRAIEISNYLEDHTLEKIDRPSLDYFVIGLASEIGLRRQRIIDRLELRLKQGLINEVEQLLMNGVSVEMLMFYGLEYKFVASYVSGTINYDTLKEKLAIAICQFAKRQMTFFRKMEKDGVKINWINADNSTGLIDSSLSLYDSYLKTRI